MLWSLPFLGSLFSFQQTTKPFHSFFFLLHLSMSNYLPVLLVSVTTNAIPDDSALSTLPRGQVDYLSHEWQEEDVWRSWRNMTRQKNEIANGARLENASWRTWWKQRNKLKTISPETLNWCDQLALAFISFTHFLRFFSYLF